MTKTTISHATLWATTASLVGGLLIFWVLRYGSDIEAVAAPIYTEVTLNYIIRNEESADILFTGNKNRSCLYHGADVKILKGGRWVKGHSTVLNAEDGEISIDEQRVNKGSPFVRRLRVEPSGSAIKLTLEATCHPLWTSYQELPAITAQVQQDNSKPNSGVAQR